MGSLFSSIYLKYDIWSNAMLVLFICIISYSYSIGFKWKIFSCTYVHIYAPKEYYATFFPISTFLYNRIQKKKKNFSLSLHFLWLASAHNLNSFNFIIQKNNVCALFFPNAGNEVLKAEQFLETIIKGAYHLPCFYAFRKTASISYLWMIRVLLLGKEEVVWLLNIF